MAGLPGLSRAHLTIVAARPGNAPQSRQLIRAQQKLRSGRRKVVADQLRACRAEVLHEQQTRPLQALRPIRRS